MPNQADDVVVLQVVECFTELLLADLLHAFLGAHALDAAGLPFGLEEIVEICVLQPRLVDSIPELRLNILDEIADYPQLLRARLRLPRRDDVHVDLARRRIRRRLLQRRLDQEHCLLNILPLHELGQAHLGQGLGDPDHRLELPWRGRHGLGRISEGAHLDVLLDQVHLDGVGDFGFDALAGEGDVLGEEVTVDSVGAE